MDIKNLEKIAKLRGISVQTLLEIDRNVRALYTSETEIDRVTTQVIKDNYAAIKLAEIRKGKER